MVSGAKLAELVDKMEVGECGLSGEVATSIPSMVSGARIPKKGGRGGGGGGGGEKLVEVKKTLYLYDVPG